MRIHLVACCVMASLGLFAVSCSSSGGNAASCSVGTEACACTSGGACDPGLTCLSGLCVDAGMVPDAGVGPDAGGCETGCTKVDVLFAIDHSASMVTEAQALAGGATEIFGALAAINCGDTGFRIGVTDDNDGGFIVPSGFTGNDPWFDSDEMSPAMIATAFEGATQELLGGPATDLGCEHVLTSATDLLTSDTTGFVRSDALLVLVLISDVDDYGAFDQGTIDCGPAGSIEGCATPPPPLTTLIDQLSALKGMDLGALTAIVVAGDPNMLAGVNLCGQPASCCGPSDCDAAFHATRLWAFAEMLNDVLPQPNGSAADICDGPTSVPLAVTQAIEGGIDQACRGFPASQ